MFSIALAAIILVLVAAVATLVAVAGHRAPRKPTTAPLPANFARQIKLPVQAGERGSLRSSDQAVNPLVPKNR